ncbi:hypothetical protein [Paraburkholderia dinghuensis]|uniref:Uncharacterized protein n=1 Tax=Paraburkholderia dinghuensis TaxID=2305225 RepID=A0A3N6Q944_9BURK|nr:hypothetical protein [Paraburkholderia dinghuensis]RQH09086.1 hypothetical protein D1Y85_04275 [Paraburkholderia dinghuensis]
MKRPSTSTQEQCTNGNTRSWATDDELEFLDHLAAGQNAADRLHGYIRALHRRTDFGVLDSGAILSHAKRLLREVERVAG